MFGIYFIGYVGLVWYFQIRGFSPWISSNGTYNGKLGDNTSGGQMDPDGLPFKALSLFMEENN